MYIIRVISKTNPIGEKFVAGAVSSVSAHFRLDQIRGRNLQLSNLPYRYWSRSIINKCSVVRVYVRVFISVGDYL